MRNNGGGHYNHTLFWKIMKPGGGGAPSGELADAINSVFGSFDDMKKKLIDAGVGQFGSGWAWLGIHEGKLHVGATPNQDCPVMFGHTPILGIDVWEHAYYLNYQNRRPDYISAFFEIINWNKVSELYASLK